MSGRGGRGRPFSLEFREQAVRLVRESGRSVPQVAKQIGIGESTLYKWIERASVDAGERPGTTSEELAELKALRKQVRSLAEENEFLKKASAFFAAETDRSRRNQNSG